MMKCRLRESRLIAINEGERSLTAADVSAVYQINGDETKRSARNRMLASSHAGRGTRLPSTWKLGRPPNTRALTVQMLRPTDFFLVFRVLMTIQFDLPGLRGSCAASTYSVEDRSEERRVGK